MDSIIRNLEEIQSKIKKEDSDYKELQQLLKNEKEAFNSVDNEIQGHIDSIKRAIANANKRKSDLINKITSKENSEVLETSENEPVNENRKISLYEPLKKHYILPNQKIFKDRNSLITDLMNNPNFETIYNIVVAMFILLALKHFIGLLLVKKEIELAEKDLYNFAQSQLYNFGLTFHGFIDAFFFILFIFGSSIIQIVILNVISMLIPSTFVLSIIVMLLIFFQLIFYAIYCKLYYDQMSCINSFGMACEVLRNMSKIFSYFYFSFVDPNKSQRGSIFSEISSYIYFNFAPTLIYSKNYAIVKVKNKFTSMFFHLLNIFSCLTLSFIIFEFELLPYFGKINSDFEMMKKYSYPENETNLQIFFHLTVHVFLAFHVLFYGFSHSYFNFFADLLNFGDRKFYDSFWKNATPLMFGKKAGFLCYELIVYGVSPFFANILKMTGYWNKLILISLVCFSLEYLVFFTIKEFFPVSSIIFVIGYFLSYFMQNMNIIRLNSITILIYSLGMGIIFYSLFFVRGMKIIF